MHVNELSAYGHIWMTDGCVRVHRIANLKAILHRNSKSGNLAAEWKGIVPYLLHLYKQLLHRYTYVYIYVVREIVYIYIYINIVYVYALCNINI